jgi:hypothetical protein
MNSLAPIRPSIRATLLDLAAEYRARAQAAMADTSLDAKRACAASAAWHAAADLAERRAPEEA